MSKLTEQLREALDTADGIKTDYAQIFAVIMLRARALLTEHEKLEREMEAGKVLADVLGNLEENPAGLDHTGWYSQNEVDNAFEAYRTACKK